MSYIKYDEFGLLEISCLNCGTPVAVRTYTKIKVKTIPAREEKVLTVRKLGNHRTRRYDLEDGSYIDVIICANCLYEDIEPEKIEKAVEDAWVATWEHENKDKDLIKKLKQKAKIKIKV